MFYSLVFYSLHFHFVLPAISGQAAVNRVIQSSGFSAWFESFQMKKFEGSQGSRKLDLFAMIMINMMNTQTHHHVDHHDHLWADGVHHDGDLLYKRCLPGQPGHQGIWAFCLTYFSR